MARELKVYTWTDQSPVLPEYRDKLRIQKRACVAARSEAEVTRLAGVKYPRQLFNLGVTGNSVQIAKAMSEPGTIFVAALDDWSSDRTFFRLDEVRNRA